MESMIEVLVVPQKFWVASMSAVVEPFSTSRIIPSAPVKELLFTRVLLNP